MYPRVKGSEARRLIAEDEFAAAAFDEREKARLISAQQVAPMRRASRAEEQRVRRMLEQDRVDRAEEAARLAAQLEVDGGKTVYVADTVVPPTREQLASGGFVPHYPRQPDNTVRTVRTVRRVQNAYVRRLFRSCRIDLDQYRACIWYRETHEIAGLVARCATTRFSSESRSGNVAYGHLPANQRELQARLAFRAARQAIGDAGIRFFDRIVIDDVPLLPDSNAQSKGARKRALQRFVAMVDTLLAHLDLVGLDLGRVNIDARC